MSENWESEELRTKAEKARAVAKAGRYAEENGWTHEEAAGGAAHEIRHAMADPKPAIVGVEPNEGRMYYEAIGNRTPEEMRAISLAPGKDMSIVDQAVHDSTHSLKELLILKVESLLKFFGIRR